RGRQPAVSPAGQDLRPGVRARAGGAGARIVRRALRNRVPDPRRRGSGAVRRRDLDREHAPLDPRADRLFAPRQPGAGGQRAIDWYRAGSARRRDAQAGIHGGDTDSTDRRAAQPGCRGGNVTGGLNDMSQTTIAPGAANFVAGQWTAARGGGTYERHNPWRPSETVGEFPSSGAEDVDAAVAAAADAFGAWSGLPAAKRGAFLA